MSKKNEGKAKLGLLLALVVAFIAVSVNAYTVKRTVDADGTEIFLLDDSGNLTIGGTMTSAGAQTITAGGLTITAGNLTVTAGDIISTVGDLTVTLGNTLLSAGNLTMTDGEFKITAGKFSPGSYTETIADDAVITNQGAVVILTGTSGGTTNTLLNPTAAGEFFTLINGSSFAIDIADSGNLKLSAAASLFQDDTLSLISVSSSVWVEVSRSTNTP